MSHFPQVDRATLDALLKLGTETATLDFKRELDLDDAGAAIELAKDIGAMSRLGGHLVIGVDDHGDVHPGGGIDPSQEKKFDEANLRGKIGKYVGVDCIFHTAIHDVGGTRVGLVHVEPSPGGFVMFAIDGTYPDRIKTGKTKTAFRAGQVYIRRGTASVAADPADMSKIVAEAVRKQAATSLPARPEWSQGAADFRDAVDAAFEANSDIALQRFLEGADTDLRIRLDDPGASADEILQVLNRLMEFGALAMRRGRSVWVAPVADALYRAYRAGLDASGSPRHGMCIAGHIYLRAVIERVYGLGAVAVETKTWEAVPLLDARDAAPDLPHARRQNWIRQATVEASRARAMKLPGDDREFLFPELVVQGEVGANSLVNRNIGNVYRFRQLVLQFEAIATVDVWSRLSQRDLYPYHRGYEGELYEPALAELITSPELRAAVFPGTDAELATVLDLIESASMGGEFAKYPGGGWAYENTTIRDFIKANLPA